MSKQEIEALFKTEFMKEAIRLSAESVEHGGGPFGAVVVKGDEIIARGNNKVTKLNDPTAHAEVVAIRNACEELGDFQLEDCVIYTSCEPCPMCLGAIYWARPKVIFYANTKVDAAKIGFDDQFIYDEIEMTPDSRSIPMINMMGIEALKVFSRWDGMGDKEMY